MAPPSPVSVPEKLLINEPPVILTVGPSLEGNEVGLIHNAPPPNP